MLTIPRFFPVVKAKKRICGDCKKDLIQFVWTGVRRRVLHLIRPSRAHQIEHALTNGQARDARKRLRVQLQLRPMALDRPGGVRVGLVIHQHPRAALDEAAVNHALQELRARLS